MGLFRKILGGGDSIDVFGDPDFSQAFELTGRGSKYGQRGKFSQATECFKKALQVKSDHVPAYLGLSTVYREQGDYDRALEVLESSPPKVKMGDELMDLDFAFDIAFQKALVLVVKHQQTDFKGEMNDLVSALEEAQQMGRNQAEITRSQEEAATALGINLKAERQEKLATIDGLLAEIRNR